MCTLAGHKILHWIDFSFYKLDSSYIVLFTFFGTKNFFYAGAAPKAVNLSEMYSVSCF